MTAFRESVAGYWCKSWQHTDAPAFANVGLAFSGCADPKDALSACVSTLKTLGGVPYICFGGGNQAGSFTEAILSEINSAIVGGDCTGYKGIAFDVEEGSTGLADDFANSFATARRSGFEVLVTVSHSAPYGISDAATLMQSFFQNRDIKYLSPQLYTTGSETENDWTTSAQVSWQDYANAKASVVPSLTQASLYAQAQQQFASYGVTIGGYIAWNC